MILIQGFRRLKYFTVTGSTNLTMKRLLMLFLVFLSLQAKNEYQLIQECKQVRRRLTLDFTQANLKSLQVIEMSLLSEFYYQLSSISSTECSILLLNKFFRILISFSGATTSEHILTTRELIMLLWHILDNFNHFYS